jgi:hypothetical protein
MIRWRLGSLALLAGLGFCVGCSNMGIGHGQMMARLTGRESSCPCSCSSPCLECDCPCPCTGSASYGMAIESRGVLTTGPALPMQMGPATSTGPGPLFNPVPPRLEPQLPVQQSQPIAADPQSRIIQR